ncbi:MAG TPA: murein biosynthesis integral membrane protein MurJ [Methylomirabilota bacterium]|nr:murein biosynthesis integral membrane protein MurJ [Methylomirabilota bacterium]
MLKSSGAMGAATLSSRLLGVVRESLYAAFMGDGPVAGAFTIAFLIPNLFRRLLGEGALTAAFVPLFKEKERTEGEESMWKAANEVLSGLTIAAVVIIALVLLGISAALYLDRPDAVTVAARQLELQGAGVLSPTGAIGAGYLTAPTELMLRLLRIMFPYMLFICATAMFMGMLNSRGHFFVPAMGSTVLNVVMIACVLWVAPQWGATLDQQIFALAFAVLFAGVAQMLYQLPQLYREGFRLRWSPPWQSESVRAVVQRMLPGMMGVAAFQINVLLTQGIAWTFDDSKTINASFGYAVRLMELPQGLFGISLATYLLPTLAGIAADKDFPKFRRTLKQGLGHVYFANLLATGFLIVLSVPIIRFLFERKEFTEASTERASFALACLAPGLIAFSTVNILARAFYALGDMKTPMRISMFCLALNIFLTLWLIEPFKQGGLGIANSISAFMNAGLLFYALRRKLKYLEIGSLKTPFIQMAISAAIAAVIAYAGYRLWAETIGHANILARAGEVFTPMILATALYFTILTLLKNPQADEYIGLIASKLGRKNAPPETAP